MKIEDQDINLDVNLANRAGRIYRQQYGRDLVDDMTELYKKLHKSPLSGLDMSGIDPDNLTEQEIFERIMAKVNLENYMTQNVLSFEDTETAGKIIWAFAKNRNESIPNYEDWIDGFDFVFPVEEIISALFDAWGKSARPTVELKN
jgi:hypothetical protein